MTDKYHKRKLEELAKDQAARIRAITDYNIMMGILDDPSQDEEGEEDESL